MFRMEFSRNAYRELLSVALESSIMFSTVAEQTMEPGITLRHDVDLHLELCLDVIEVELELGIRSTFYVMLNNPFYNVYETNSISILRRLVSDGFEVGVHFNLPQANLCWSMSQEDQLQRDMDVLRSICGTNNHSFAPHQPSTSLAGLKVSGAINAYSPPYFSAERYLSDSRLMFRRDPIEFVKRGSYERIQLLLHPEYYQKLPCNLVSVAAVLKSLTRKSQIDFLSQHDMLQQAMHQEAHN